MSVSYGLFRLITKSKCLQGKKALWTWTSKNHVLLLQFYSTLCSSVLINHISFNHISFSFSLLFSVCNPHGSNGENTFIAVIGSSVKYYNFIFCKRHWRDCEHSVSSNTRNSSYLLSNFLNFSTHLPSPYNFIITTPFNIILFGSYSIIHSLQTTY